MHLYAHLKFEALELFKKEGGTHAFIVSLPSTYYDLKPKKGEDFKKIFDFHVKLVKKANKIVKSFAVLSVHPAEITILGQRLGYEKAAEIMKDAISLAAKYIENGEAVAIKSGRPHYSVSKKVWELSNDILKHAFEVAKDVGCAVQIHTESFTKEGMLEIAKLADEAGLPREKVIKHFAPPLVSEFEEIGLFPSVLASGDNPVNAAKQGTRFVLETDYIDDPKRPGAVLGPKTVPKKVKELLKLGYSEDFIWKICGENIEKLYNVEISL